MARGDELDPVARLLPALICSPWRGAVGEVSVLQTAKALLRQALAAHLGDAPLKSRDLFRPAPVVGRNGRARRVIAVGTDILKVQRIEEVVVASG